MTIPIISFFTGGGFLDIGFEKANFDVRWTNECSQWFADIYAHGVTAWRQSQKKTARSASISHVGSIEDLSSEDVLKQAFNGKRPGIFGVIGGPPCTDFSIGGLQAGHEGDAGKLTAVYVRMLLGLEPDFFLLENVPHLESSLKHRDRFLELIAVLDKSGYAVKTGKINSLEHGVPQDRLRLFVVGFKKALIRKWYPEEHFPTKAFSEHFSWPKPTFPGAKKHYRWAKTNRLSYTPVQPVDVPLELCVYSAVCGSKDPESLPNGKDYFNPYSSKFAEIDEGDVSGKSFKRLHRYRYSPTVWYGNNEVHLHPWKRRRLSVREALRIQTVPDTYIMPEDIPLSAKFKVIGNGVPCLLAQKIASAISEFIEKSQKKLG